MADQPYIPQEYFAGDSLAGSPEDGIPATFMDGIPQATGAASGWVDREVYNPVGTQRTFSALRMDADAAVTTNQTQYYAYHSTTKSAANSDARLTAETTGQRLNTSRPFGGTTNYIGTAIFGDQTISGLGAIRVDFQTSGAVRLLALMIFPQFYWVPGYGQGANVEYYDFNYQLITTLRNNASYDSAAHGNRPVARMIIRPDAGARYFFSLGTAQVMNVATRPNHTFLPTITTGAASSWLDWDAGQRWDNPDPIEFVPEPEVYREFPPMAAEDIVIWVAYQPATIAASIAMDEAWRSQVNRYTYSSIRTTVGAAVSGENGPVELQYWNIYDVGDRNAARLSSGYVVPKVPGSNNANNGIGNGGLWVDFEYSIYAVQLSVLSSGPWVAYVFDWDGNPIMDAATGQVFRTGAGSKIQCRGLGTLNPSGPAKPFASVLITYEGDPANLMHDETQVGDYLTLTSIRYFNNSW